MKEANIGKIINLVSNDMNAVEFKLFFFFILCVTPFVLIASLIILYIRLGYWGLLSIGILLCYFPLQSKLGKYITISASKKSELTDKRIKLLTELIDGIKLIKMHAWELAF